MAARRSAPPPLIRLLVLVDDFRFDDVVLVAAAAAGIGIAARRRSGAATGVRAGVLVHDFRELVRGLREGVGRLLKVVHTALLHGLAGVADSRLEILHVAAGDLVAVLAQHLLYLVGERVELVLRFDLLTPLLVLFGVSLGVAYELLAVV